MYIYIYQTSHVMSCRHPGDEVSGGGPFEGLVFCGKLCGGTRSFDPGE